MIHVSFMKYFLGEGGRGYGQRKREISPFHFPTIPTHKVGFVEKGNEGFLAFAVKCQLVVPVS